MGTEDDVKVATDPNLSEHAKKSEHDNKVLLAEQRSSEQRPSQENNEEELKRQERIFKIFEQQDKMDYLKYEEMMEQGGDVIELTDDHRVGEGSPRAFHVNPYAAAYEARERVGLPYELDRGTGDYAAFAASYASKYECWKY